MFGSRFFTFFTTALAASTVVSAFVAEPIEARAPGSGAVAAKRQSSDDQVATILDNLATNIAPSLAGIQSLGGDATTEKATPYFSELTGHINDATSSIQNVSPSARVKARGQPDVIANKCATIIISIVTACNGLSIIVSLGGLLATLDFALCALLKAVEGIVAGVLILVAKLLVTVSVILIKLSFVLTCGLLGISIL